VVAASWSNNQSTPPPAKAVDAAAAISPVGVEEAGAVVENNTCFNGENVEFE
ncbi:Hypothetical predicted protein, partial [Olea europaea subsp. europaea]